MMTIENASAFPGKGLPESAGDRAPQRRAPDHWEERQTRQNVRAVICIDVIGALVLAAGSLWFYLDMRALYLHANLHWGQADEGARLALVGDMVGIVFWLLPAALLCTVAAIGMWRSWQARWLIQATAGGWMLVMPILVFALHGFAMDVALSGCPSSCWIQAFSPG